MVEYKDINDNYGIVYPNGMEIKTIKSKFNNQILSVKPNKIDKTSYSININDKCLYGYTDDYSLKECSTTDSYMHPQYFNAININNRSIEKKYMNGVNNDIQPEPYTVFVHKSTQQCLTIDNEGVYISNCDADNIQQKWKVSPDENICLDN
jgi:hypothetical protein